MCPLVRAGVVLLVLLASSCTATRGTPRAPSFRVISYNVLVGFGDYAVGDPYHPGAVRKRNVTAFLAAEAPDVVVLQEMNGYSTERLTAEAAAWGHAHAVMLKESGYPTAVTSRYPIEVVERRREGMHHGLLHVRTAGVDFVVVHLWPFPGEERMREIAPALAMYERARAEGRACLVVGDFNAVAARDVPTWDDDARTRYARWKWETHADGRPRTDVIDACLAAGLHDLCDRHGALPARMRVPRVDYILASPELAARSTGARWLDAPELLRNSDHPAVVADFAWGPPVR